MMSLRAERRNDHDTDPLRGALHLEESVWISSSPPVVFAWLDDPRNTGWHMSRPSMAMRGSVQRTEQISTNPSGLGAAYRSRGRIMELPLDFTARVTRWMPDRQKVWRTIGEPRLIVLGAFEMRLTVTPEAGGTRLVAGIDYTLPTSWAGRLLGRFLARPYSRWCPRRVCRDAKAALGRT